MADEIRKEETWLGFGPTKEVIYRDGEKIGEVKHETTWLGEPVTRAIDNEGNPISETRIEKTWLGLGPTVQRTYDPNGQLKHETRREETLLGFGPTITRIYGPNGELIRERWRGLFGEKKEREYKKQQRSSGDAPYADDNGPTSGYPSSMIAGPALVLVFLAALVIMIVATIRGCQEQWKRENAVSLSRQRVAAQKRKTAARERKRRNDIAIVPAPTRLRIKRVLQPQGARLPRMAHPAEKVRDAS